MKYDVAYTEQFIADIENHVDYLLKEGVSVERVAGWYDKVFERLDRLDEMPKRLPVDDRQTELNGYETRKLNHRDYLAFFAVDDGRRRVTLLKFQHGAKQRVRQGRASGG